MLSQREIQHDGIYWAISRHGTSDSRRYGDYQADRGIVTCPVPAPVARHLLALGLRVADAREYLPRRSGTTVEFVPTTGLPWRFDPPKASQAPRASHAPSEAPGRRRRRKEQ